MNVEDFRLLYDFNAWADHRTLEACAALNDEQFTRDLGSSYRSVRDTLVHIMLVEWLWLERWHGRSPTSYAANEEFPNLESVRARWPEIERDLLDYIASLTPEEVQRVVQHKTTAGVPQAQPLWQMLQHLVNHGSLSSRPGSHDAPPIGRETHRDGLDPFLPRARRPGQGMISTSRRASASKLLHRKRRQDQYGVRRRAAALRMQIPPRKLVAEALSSAAVARPAKILSTRRTSKYRQVHLGVRRLAAACYDLRPGAIKSGEASPPWRATLASSQAQASRPRPASSRTPSNFAACLS